MVKFQSYLAGCVFSLLLAGHIAMAMLDFYPTSGYMWHVNLAFARDVRPLLNSLDLLSGAGTLGAVAVLSLFAGLAVLSARRNLRLLAAGMAHIALAMVLVVMIRSYSRTQPRGLTASLGDMIAAAFSLPWVQYGLFVLACVLLATCLWSHVRILQRGIEHRRRRAAANAIKAGPALPSASTAAHPSG